MADPGTPEIKIEPVTRTYVRVGPQKEAHDHIPYIVNDLRKIGFTGELENAGEILHGIHSAVGWTLEAYKKKDDLVNPESDEQEKVKPKPLIIGVVTNPTPGFDMYYVENNGNDGIFIGIDFLNKISQRISKPEPLTKKDPDDKQQILIDGNTWLEIIKLMTVREAALACEHRKNPNLKFEDQISRTKYLAEIDKEQPNQQILKLQAKYAEDMHFSPTAKASINNRLNNI